MPEPWRDEVSASDPGSGSQPESASINPAHLRDRGKLDVEFNRGEEGDQFKNDELMAADVQLLGRITYQAFAAVWPEMRESMASSARR